MNPDQLFGILRAGIPPLAAAVSNWGIGNSVQNTSIITAVAWGAVSAWSWFSNSQNAKILSINSADNGVSVVPTKEANSAGIEPVNTVLK